jgi:hypothetical protein
MRILIVVPTTGGPLLIRSLRLRAALPASAVFADGDYRPLPWSPDYARLSGPHGPFAGSEAAGNYELRLDRSFDTGRSWEAPVALAHALLARGHTIVGDNAQAEIVLWATGAVALDLHLLPGGYSLVAKIEKSSELISAAAAAKTVFVLPPGDERGEAAAGLAAQARSNIIVIEAADVTTAAQQVDKLKPESMAPPERSPAKPSAWWPVAAFMLIGLLVVGVWSIMREGGHMAVPSPVVAEADPPQTSDQKTEELKPMPIDGAVSIDELRAPPGRSCRQVVFDVISPVHVPVAMTDAHTFAPTAYDTTLCGLSFRARDPRATSFTVSQALKAVTVAPASAPGSGETFYLRDQGRQNVVYTVQVFAIEGNSRKLQGTLSHALIP